MNPSPEPKRMKGVGRVAFIAQLADITADLEAGWPVKAVYQKRADKLGISYAQFARYVDQIVRRRQRQRDPPGCTRRRRCTHASQRNRRPERTTPCRTPPRPPRLQPRPDRAPGRPPPPPRRGMSLESSTSSFRARAASARPSSACCSPRRSPARVEPVICVDTDPVNASLSSLSTMDPERVSIFQGKKVDTRALDLFVERLLSEDSAFRGGQRRLQLRAGEPVPARERCRRHDGRATAVSRSSTP